MIWSLLGQVITFTSFFLFSFCKSDPQLLSYQKPMRSVISSLQTKIILLLFLLLGTPFHIPYPWAPIAVVNGSLIPVRAAASWRRRISGGPWQHRCLWVGCIRVALGTPWSCRGIPSWGCQGRCSSGLSSPQESQPAWHDAPHGSFLAAQLLSPHSSVVGLKKQGRKWMEDSTVFSVAFKPHIHSTPQIKREKLKQGWLWLNRRMLPTCVFINCSPAPPKIVK